MLAVVREAMSLADVVLGSGPEELVPLARALGFDADGVASAGRALAGGERTIVARLGAAGAIACPPDGGLLTAPGFVVDMRSPVGAGDAFNAGFICGPGRGGLAPRGRCAGATPLAR